MGHELFFILTEPQYFSIIDHHQGSEFALGLHLQVYVISKHVRQIDTALVSCTLNFGLACPRLLALTVDTPTIIRLRVDLFRQLMCMKLL